jgi:hypothetical protein
MSKSMLLFLGAAVAATMCLEAQAGSVVIDPVGGGVTLQSGDLSATVFGDSQPNWSTSSLTSVHSALNGSGISTNGKVTILLADTDQGLSLLVLVDQQSSTPGSDVDGHLQMTSFANGANLAYIHDIGGSVLITPNSPTSRLATGELDWNSNGAGDGFGWSNLAAGNTITFHFDQIGGSNLGLDNSGTFQFATWNGSAWQLLSLSGQDSSFTDAGEYGFSLLVAVPLPAGAAMGALPLAGLAMIRRRRATV